MTAPTALLLLTGLAFLIIGVWWWRSDPVSAGRPASLLVMFGIAFCLCAVWWVWGPYGFGVVIAALVCLALMLMLSRPAGGNVG